MRFVCIDTKEGVQLGVRQGSRIGLIGPADRDGFARLASLSPDELGTSATVRAEDAAYAPPVPPTGKIICIGLNYRAHALEGGHEIPDYPAVFTRYPGSLVGHDGPLLLPAVSSKFDYEAELALIIGRTAHRVTRDEALQHVLGYTCFNDGSLRDYQRRSSQWIMGKNFHQSGAVGPDIVTADELPPGAHGLRIVARLNGVTVQDSNTAELIFEVPRLIEIISEVMVLEPGDVIATGTPAGAGFARTPPLFMRAGDRVEVEIDGLGTLSNRVVPADALAT